MNDLLRDTFAERADGIEPPPLDLDGIVAAGNRRISRRRALTVLGGAVATAAVAVGTATVIRPRNAQPQPARPAPFAQRRPTFALGNNIHYGDEVISVAPQQVITFVQTDVGFVFLNQNNDIHVADKSGVRRLGKSAGRLTADVRGNLVGWVEAFNDHYESVVYDVAARREVVRTRNGNTIPPTASLAVDARVVALDGNFAYFGTQDGLYRWDIVTNQGERLAAVGPAVVRTVTAGQFVYQQPLDRFRATSLAIAQTVTATAPARFVGQQAFLSPGAKYLVTEPYDAKPGVQPLWANLLMYDVTSGKRVGLPHDYLGMFFGQWLDDATCTIAGERRTPTAGADLLVVSARTGAVDVAVPSFSKLTFSTKPPRTAPFALPTGNPIYDLY
jgi:hypothetical protein